MIRSCKTTRGICQKCLSTINIIHTNVNERVFLRLDLKLKTKPNPVHFHFFHIKLQYNFKQNFIDIISIYLLFCYVLLVRNCLIVQGKSIHTKFGFEKFESNSSFIIAIPMSLQKKCATTKIILKDEFKCF